MAQVIDFGLIDRAVSRMRRVLRRATGREAARMAGELEGLIQAALASQGGEIAARGRAAALGTRYRALDDAGRAELLVLLAERFGRDAEAVDAALARATATDGAAREGALAALAAALEPARAILFRRLAAMPDGLGFLIALRADVRRFVGDRPQLAALDDELRDLLALWFDPALLELVRLDWDAPAAFLEKLIAYEAVHDMAGWDDLKRRLAADRRVFALRHPLMPSEPLIFVEVALVQGLPERIADLIGPALPVGDPTEADTAVFYAISNAQPGLAGVPLGNALIKTAMARLQDEMPWLGTFVTLSPVPGFRGWLDRVASTPDGAAEVKRATGLDAAAVAAALAAGGAAADDLVRLVAHYIARARTADGRATDPVAHFHFGNGARLERVLAGADTGRRAQSRSGGVMVNYLYDPETLEGNVDAYAATGAAALGAPAKRALRPAGDGRGAERASA